MRPKDALQAGQRFQPRGREPWTAGTRPEAGLCMLNVLYTGKALKHTPTRTATRAPGAHRIGTTMLSMERPTG